MGFQELIKKISPKLKGIVYKIKAGRDYSAIEDLYQEALMHLWCRFTSGELADKTDSYILQSCYFYLKNHMRKNYFKAKLVSLSEVNEQNEDEISLDSCFYLKDSHSFREEIHCSMLIEQIKNNGFTKREKEVFLFALEGLTTREIGARLGISHVRVVKLRQAMQHKCQKYIDYR